MDTFEDYKKRIGRKLNVVDAKLSYMHDGLKGLTVAFKDFKDEMDDFIDFTSESYSSHEKRIQILEEKIS